MYFCIIYFVTKSYVKQRDLEIGLSLSKNNSIVILAGINTNTYCFCLRWLPRLNAAPNMLFISRLCVA